MFEGSLKKLILENLIGREFMKISSNKIFRQQIVEETAGLNEYYPEISLKQRAYILANDIRVDDLPYCKCGCGKRASLKREVMNGFSSYYNEDCHRRALKVSDVAIEKLSDKEWKGLS